MLNRVSTTALVIPAALARRRGSMMVYSIYIMLVSCAMISVAVDYGRIQMIKSQEQRSADALARGMLAALLANANTVKSNGMTYYQAFPYLASYGVPSRIEAANPVDANSGIAPTYEITVGAWDGTTFHPNYTPTSSWPMAVYVRVSRTAGNDNAVPLAFPLPNGTTFMSRKIDVWAKAIAILPNTVSFGETVQATQDPWLAGMPMGSNASDDDYINANSVTAASNPSNGYDNNTTISVTPGSVVTYTAVSPHLSHLQPPVYYGADGMPGNNYWHLKDGPVTEPMGSGGQNGIGDIYTPIDSIIGVFLNDNAPTDASNSQYATYANANMRTYTSDVAQNGVDNLHLQQPFYIGDGTNNSGGTQTFVVPDGATRLFLGMMDGYEWSNNSGQFSVSGNVQPPIQMVQ